MMDAVRIFCVDCTGCGKMHTMIARTTRDKRGEWQRLIVGKRGRGEGFTFNPKLGRDHLSIESHPFPVPHASPTPGVAYVPEADAQTNTHGDEYAPAWVGCECCGRGTSVTHSTVVAALAMIAGVADELDKINDYHVIVPLNMFLAAVSRLPKSRKR